MAGRTPSSRSTRSSTRSSRSSSTPGRTTPGWRPTARPSAELLEFRESEGEPHDMSAAEWREFAAAGVAVRRPREGEGAGRRRRRGTASGRRHPRATTRSAAASPTRSPSRLPQRRSPTSSGWRPRPRTSPTPSEFADAIHAVFPDQMLAYNLSPSFNWDTTGMTDDEMRALPRGTRQDGLRLQLHHLRRTPDRRRRRRGVRHRAQAGRHAGAGSPAAQDAPGRIALPHTANPGRRTAQRRRAGRLVGPHGDHQVHGQGLHAAPASRADRGARRSCWRNGWRCGATTTSSARSCACSCARCARAATCSSSASTANGDGGREAGQRGRRSHQGPARPQHPDGARPEHVRREAAPEAPDGP